MAKAIRDEKPEPARHVKEIKGLRGAWAERDGCCDALLTERRREGDLEED
jgi:hypothetical protein